MENKYYTPTIEEFHVGFEYEVLEKAPKPDKNGHIWLTTFPELTEDTWYSFKYPDPFLGYRVDKLLEKRDVRVKYLDKEDIESLGFKITPSTGDRIFTKNYYYGTYIELRYEPINKILNVEINKSKYDLTNHNIFNGSIKNKSELKKLLKQLDIE